MKSLLNKLVILFTILTPSITEAQNYVQIADSVRFSRSVPAMAYAVITSDSIIEVGFCGFRKFRTRDSLRMQDRFDIGTNTAALTSYIAARLVESGKIDWTTKLLDVFPEFKSRCLPVYRNISLSDLLSNQTRLPLYATLDDWYKIPDFTGNTMSARRKNFTLFMIEQKPYMENVVSRKIEFSMAGYVVATSMLEKVAHKKWENLVNDYINDPLKMNCKFGWPNLTDTAAAIGHWSQGNYFHSEDANTWVKPNALLYPAHDINMDLSDYIRFMQEMLRALKGEKAHISQSNAAYILYGIPDYSLGWNNGSLNDYTYAFHEGISLLYNCRAEVIKEKNTAIIVLCNSGDRDGRGAVVNLVRILEAKFLDR